MFKKLKLFSIFFIAFLASAYSQSDNIIREIAMYRDSSSMLISNARNLLVSKLRSDDKKAVIELRDFLVKAETKDHVSLFPTERWLIGYYLNDLVDVLLTVNQFDSAYYSSFKYRKRPEYDLLEKSLSDYTTENFFLITSNIESSAFMLEEIDFLKLHLKFLIEISNQTNKPSDALNDSASRFISQYPHSRNVLFVRRYIRYQFEPSSGGTSGYFGMGARLNSGKIANSIDEGLLFYLGIGVPYNNWDYDFRLSVGPVNLKKEVVQNGLVW